MPDLLEAVSTGSPSQGRQCKGPQNQMQLFLGQIFTVFVLGKPRLIVKPKAEGKKVPVILS